MSNSIFVNVSELRSLVQDIRRSGMDIVEVSISEADDDFPASLNFSACKSCETDTWADFEPLDAVDNSSQLEEASLYGTHMSSNLL